MVGLSFLGPFFAPSVFPEEDPGVADKYFKETILPFSFKVVGIKGLSGHAADVKEECFTYAKWEVVNYGVHASKMHR